VGEDRNIRIRQLSDNDLTAADRIFRLAFGTFLGLPDPMDFARGSGTVATRWRADPAANVCAEMDGEVVGSNFAANWGSFGFFGPLSVRPDLWEKKIAQRMLHATMTLFERWGTRHTGLFTFSDSPKHLALYQKYGFWPRFLTLVLAKPPSPEVRSDAAKFSALSADDQQSAVKECRALTNAIFDGLDLTHEIRAVADQKLGDTLLVRSGSRLIGFAVCHCGAGSEAGADATYVKFAAAASADGFARTLEACEAFARESATRRLIAGVNFAREAAFRIMAPRGFRTFIQGVAMQRPNEPGFNRTDAFVIDDWR
jgi:GNAT superfamily N-acetyltransferase